jgi:hypothetical protein
MKVLNREALLKKEDLEVVAIDFGNGEGIYVRQMTGYERDIWERSIIDVDDKGNVKRKMDDFRAKLVVCTACDQSGKLLFKQADAKALSHSMSASRLEKIVEVAQRINKITEQDKEELVKN